MSDYIPSELIPNILARLAVKDVLRCTSVCKSWYSLITSPYFTSSHLNLSAPNQDPRFLIKCLKNKITTLSYQLRHDSQTFDEIEDLDVPSSFRNVFFDVIDCLQGLVCLHDSYENIIVLWNPTLRKHLILPKPRSRVLPHIENSKQTVGFGFIPSSNEYKIVSFISTPGSDSQAEIYEQSTGSWRNLNNLSLGDYSDVNLHAPQAHFNGILHWYAHCPKKVTSGVSFIYSFDLENEKDGSLMVPSCWRHDDNSFFVPSTIRESLCLINETSKRVFEIWVLKEYGVADSWEKLFIIIDVDKHSLMNFRSFRHDSSEILFTKYCRNYTELVSYNGKNYQVKNLGIQSLITHEIFAYTYVESLVLINVPNESRLMGTNCRNLMM